MTAYLLEKALSVDNLFVFLLIFGYFKVPSALQHRVLSFGILGAIVLRASMIGAGVLLIRRFEWLMVLFGLFLVYTSAKLLLVGEDDDEDLENNRVVTLFRRFIPMTEGYHGGRFWVQEAGKRLATPLLLVLVTIEISDVIFAVDSIPAVFGVSLDGFIIYTSNIFAILGLRALYFLLAAALDSMRFLGPAVALVLGFVGVKMCAGYAGFHTPISISLAVVLTLLVVGVVASLLFPAATAPDDENGDNSKAPPCP